jgi:AraC family transcriptional regulator, arabinose operon regulatory protein
LFAQPIWYLRIMPKKAPPTPGDLQLPPWSTVSRTHGHDEQKETFGCGCGMESGPIRKKGHIPSFAIVYLLAIDGHYVDAEGGRWPLKPGCFYLEFPGVPRAMNADGVHAEAFISFGPRLYEYLRSIGQIDTRQPVADIGFDLGIGRQILELMRDLRQSLEGDLGRQMVRALELAMRLLHLGRTRRDSSSAILDQACDLLCRRLDEDVNLEELLDGHFEFGYERLRKLFAQRLGLSPGEYRINRRIDRARDLLLSNDSGLEEIAAKLGYASPYSLSRQFKQVVGVPPSEYRKRSGYTKRVPPAP